MASECARWRSMAPPPAQVISADELRGASEGSRLHALQTIADDALATDTAAIVLDDVERLLGHVTLRWRESGRACSRSRSRLAPTALPDAPVPSERLPKLRRCEAADAVSSAFPRQPVRRQRRVNRRDEPSDARGCARPASPPAAPRPLPTRHRHHRALLTARAHGAPQRLRCQGARGAEPARPALAPPARRRISRPSQQAIAAPSVTAILAALVTAVPAAASTHLQPRHSWPSIPTCPLSPLPDLD